MQEMELGLFVLVVIIYYVDKFFMFEMKILLVLFLLKKVVGLKFVGKCNCVKGLDKFGCVVVGIVIVKQVCEIVEVKMKDLFVNDVEVVM